MPNRELARLLAEQKQVPPEERWWDDSTLDRDQLIAGLAKYALARDSRYDQLAADTNRIAEGLDVATEELRTFTQVTVRRDEVMLRGEAHKLRRRTFAIMLSTVVLAASLTTLFLLGVAVPKCFFGAGGGHAAQCRFIPGYGRAEREQRDRVGQLYQRVDTLEREQRGR